MGEQVVNPKRQRADDEEAGNQKAVDDWDIADHRREMTRVMNRRKIIIGVGSAASGDGYQLDQSAQCLWVGAVQEAYASRSGSWGGRPHTRPWGCCTGVGGCGRDQVSL